MKLTKEVKETKKDELKECLALWERNSKSGNLYYTGTDKENNKYIGFITKSDNEKAPYLNIYLQKENQDKFEDSVAVLWKNISKEGNEYLSGHDNENKKLVGFFDETPDSNVPAIRIYYK